MILIIVGTLTFISGVFTGIVIMILLTEHVVSIENAKSKSEKPDYV